MQVCSCVLFASAAERCPVNQGPAAAAAAVVVVVAWCLLEVFPTLCRSLQLDRLSLHADVVPSAMMAVTLRAY